MSTGRVVLQSAILTAVAVLGLTLFTFWAVKKGYDFTFMFPFLFTCVNVLLVYLVIQVCFPDNNATFLFLTRSIFLRATHLSGIQCNVAIHWTSQIFFPLGRFGITIYGFLATLVFSGFIVYDTHMLLKRHTYNEYVVAAISLYLDVINLFMAQMVDHVT
jgi:FtsH-binding integral membrane protein